MPGSGPYPGKIMRMPLQNSEKLRVDIGCMVAFDPSVDYDIEFVGGIKTAIFGGEGLFFASMTGPGRIWIQTLPLSRLADRIIAARRGDRGDVKRSSEERSGRWGILSEAIRKREIEN